jgi:LPXTG-motif cell wall-anchored protein
MKIAHRRHPQLLSWLIIAAMISMSLWLAGTTPVRAISDAVVNVTSGVGYGSDIQQALDAADPGDVIEVYEGEYGIVEIAKPISLIAPDGPSTVSVNMLQINAVGVVISGLTFKAETDGGGANGIEVPTLVDGSLDIEDCVFEERSGIAVRIGNWGVDRGEIDKASFTFTGNSVTGGSHGLLFLPEITDSTLVISDNTFTGDSDTYPIYFVDDVINSTVTIYFNMFTAFDEAIGGGGNQDYGYKQSTIHILMNEFEDGNIAIYLTYLLDGTDVLIFENRIIACSYGIQIYEIGNNAEIGVLPPSTVIIEDNRLYEIDYYGISLDWYYHGSVEIIGNHIHDCGYYGIYLDLVPQNWSQNQTSTTNQIDLDITRNTFTGSGEAAIYFGNMDPIPGNHVAININRNSFLFNTIGIALDYLSMNGTDQKLTITRNDFISNDIGIDLHRIYIHPDLDPFPILIRLNHFKSCADYAVVYRPRSETTPVIFAQENWWSDESGPVVKIPDQISMMNLTPAGEPVSERVEFDPWLATLVITPSQASLPINQTQTLTAQILDNEGNPVDVDGLRVVFRVSGVNTLDQDRLFYGTSATLSYPGTTVGVDTIQAEVYFNRFEMPSEEDGATGLTAEIEVIWTQAAAVTPVPTAVPTAAPTVAPTAAPTAAPTGTSQPTPVPTDEIPQTGETGSDAKLIAGLSLVILSAALMVIRKRRQLYN